MKISTTKYFAALLSFVLHTTLCHAADLRLGIIGTDSSHAVEFTRILNDETATDHIQGARIVAAFRGGNPNLALSRDRIAQFTAQLQNKWKLPLVANIQALCPQVDGILLLSVDPGSRMQEFRKAAACHKPIFVDKPLGSTLAAAKEIEQFASRHHIAWFSSSSLRFGAAQDLCSNDVTGAEVWGPGALQPDYPLDLSWYGIHSIELLFTIMGPGVQSVTRVHTEDAEVLTGVWHDNRIGALRLIRPDSKFGAVVFHPRNQTQINEDIPSGYAPLLHAIIDFVRTGKVPVSAQETLEIFSFMDAAQKSLSAGSIPVRITTINTVP